MQGALWKLSVGTSWFESYLFSRVGIAAGLLKVFPNFTVRLQRLHCIFIYNKSWLRHIRKSCFYGIRHRTNMFRSVACYLLSSDHLLFFWAAQTVVSQRFRRSFSLCQQSNRNPIFHQRVYIIKRIVIRKTVALNYPTPFLMSWLCSSHLWNSFLFITFKKFMYPI